MNMKKGKEEPFEGQSDGSYQSDDFSEDDEVNSETQRQQEHSENNIKDTAREEDNRPSTNTTLFTKGSCGGNQAPAIRLSMSAVGMRKKDGLRYSSSDGNLLKLKKSELRKLIISSDLLSRPKAAKRYAQMLDRFSR